MSKKVLLVIDNLGSGGAQNQLGLKEAGYEPIIFTYFPQDFFKPKLVAANIKVIYEAKKDKIGWNIVQKISQTINQESIITVISFLDTPNFYAAIAKFINKKIVFIPSYRSKTDISILSFFNKVKLRWINQQATHIIANSNHERNLWQNYQPSISYKWKTIYNMVDRAIFSEIKTLKTQKLLVVGSISSDKNGLIIIEALNILKQQNIYVSLNWYGEKIYQIAERKAYLEAMEAKIAIYGLNQQWTWKTPTTQLNPIYNEHYALILASEVEGLPNVVCEAMSCAIPCIISNVLDHSVLINHDKSGYLFSPQNAMELAEAIKKIYDLDGNSYNVMSKESYKQSVLLFSADKFVADYKSIIQC